MGCGHPAGALRDAGATDAAAALAARIADHASLENPAGVAQLLGALREAGDGDAAVPSLSFAPRAVLPSTAITISSRRHPRARRTRHASARIAASWCRHPAQVHQQASAAGIILAVDRELLHPRGQDIDTSAGRLRGRRGRLAVHRGLLIRCTQTPA